MAVDNPRLANAADLYLSACGLPAPPKGALYVDLPFVYAAEMVLAEAEVLSEVQVEIKRRADFWLRAVEVVTTDSENTLLAFGRVGRFFQNARVPVSIFAASASFRKLVMPQQRFRAGSRLAYSLENTDDSATQTVKIYFEGVERFFLK